MSILEREFLIKLHVNVSGIPKQLNAKLLFGIFNDQGKKNLGMSD